MEGDVFVLLAFLGLAKVGETTNFSFFLGVVAANVGIEGGGRGGGQSAVVVVGGGASAGVEGGRECDDEFELSRGAFCDVDEFDSLGLLLSFLWYPSMITLRHVDV